MTVSDAASEQPDYPRSYATVLPLVLLALAILAYAGYFSFLTISRYNAFEARALDMGNLNQAIWNTAHGNWFRLTNQPGIDNRLSLHVEPILLPIAALYRLWPDPRLLLGLQATVVALGAIPTYFLAKYRLRNAWLALVFAGSFLLHPTIQAANWLEFHPVTLAPTFLLAAFYFLVRRRDGWFALFAILSASCKEEIALLVFMMGLYAFLRWKRRRLGIVTMILSMGWALLAVLGIQNLFASGNIHWERYGYLGDNPAEILWTLLTSPILVIEQLRKAGAASYLFLLMLPVAFLPLAGLDLFLLALPSLALNLLADFPPMHQVTTLIYAAPIVPFVIISAIYGAGRLVNWNSARQGYKLSSRAAKTLLGGGVLLCSIIAQIDGGYLPGGGNYVLFPITDHHRTARSIIDQIPADAIVSSQDKLDPHVSGRETIYIFPRIEDADTVFIDASGPAWPQHPNDVHSTVEELLLGDWGVATAADGYLLLQKGSDEKRIPPSFYDRWSDIGNKDITAMQIEFGNQLLLTGYEVGVDQHGELITTLHWQPMQPLDDDLRFYVGYSDAKGDILYDTLFYPPSAALWYPTSLWTPGETVVMTTLPWALDEAQFGLLVGVYSGDEGWQNGARLPITTTTPEMPVLDGGTVARIGGFEETSQGQWQPVDVESQNPDATQVGAIFGETIGLVDATLDVESLAAGEDLTFALTWQATDRPANDFSVFLHLVDTAGNKVGQLDWQPSDPIGPRPMRSWLPNEAIIDRQAVAVSHNAAAGQYDLILGVYDWQTGERLPVSGATARPDDSVFIGTVEVE